MLASNRSVSLIRVRPEPSSILLIEGLLLVGCQVIVIPLSEGLEFVFLRIYALFEILDNLIDLLSIKLLGGFELNQVAVLLFSDKKVDVHAAHAGNLDALFEEASLSGS